MSTTTTDRAEVEGVAAAVADVPPGQEQAAPNHRAFPALDGVRGLAVVAVVATHSAYWTGRYENGPFDGVLARMDFGVALFFLLSGFLLFRPWLEAAITGRPSPDLRVYFWRRGLRILPAYWIAVAVAFVAVGANRGHLNVWDYVRHATLTEGYWLHGFRSGFTQIWSLCVEAAFYVILPLFGSLSVRRDPPVRMAAGVPAGRLCGPGRRHDRVGRADLQYRLVPRHQHPGVVARLPGLVRGRHGHRRGLGPHRPPFDIRSIALEPGRRTRREPVAVLVDGGRALRDRGDPGGRTEGGRPADR